MSELTSTPSDLPMLATVDCPYCSERVPDARFCGACGAHLVHAGFRASQRLHSYAAFPDEPVLRLGVVTSLFPHLSHRAKAPFRIGFAVVVALLLIFALAGTSAPLIAVSALSVPLLFFIYIWEVDPYEGNFLPPTFICLLLGAGLGTGWAIIGGSYVDKALVPSLMNSLTSNTSIVAALAVPAIGQLLMCVPLVVVRRMQRGPVESLDGFVAGATGALGFTLAATIDLMSPWLSNGEITHGTFLANVAQVILRGVSLPLVSALATGFVGMAYWARTGSRATSAKGKWLTSPWLAFALALAVQIGLGFTDLAALSDAVLVAIHLAALGILTVAMRVGLHYVLLHEALDVRIGAPRVCANCTHLVPEMAFCPQCGVADRAVARPHRLGAAWPLVNGSTGLAEDTSSSESDPVQPVSAWPAAPAGAPGLKIGFPGAHELASPVHRLSHRAKVALLLAGLSALTLTLVIVALLATPGPPPPCNPLKCQGPPIGNPNGGLAGQSVHGAPVAQGTLYRNSQGFTVRYIPDSSTKTDPDGIELTYDFVRTGSSAIDIEGVPAGTITAESDVSSIASKEFPGLGSQYELPGMSIGYHPGFGAAYKVQPVSADGSTATDQVVLAAAVDDNFVITIEIVGTLIPTVSSPTVAFWNGHSSPAGTQLAYAVGDFIVNRIEFP